MIRNINNQVTLVHIKNTVEFSISSFCIRFINEFNLSVNIYSCLTHSCLRRHVVIFYTEQISKQSELCSRLFLLKIFHLGLSLWNNCYNVKLGPALFNSDYELRSLWWYDILKSGTPQDGINCERLLLVLSVKLC